MKQRLLLAACATVLIAACSDGDTTGSENPTAPGTVAFTHQGEPHVCSFRDAYAYARNYFSTNTDRNTARGYLQTAEGAAVGSATRNEALFDLLELVATVGGDPTKSNSPTDGASLVSEVVDCGGPTWVVTDGRAFSATTANALTDGLGGFAVVGGGATYGDATTNHVYAESGEAAFGLNAYQSGLTWENSLGKAVVILGKLGAGTTNFGLSQVIPLAYRVNLIYTNPPARPANFTNDDTFAAEFCSVGLDNSLAQATQRVGRNRSIGNTVLQEADIAGFCGGLAAASPRSASVFARALDRLVGFFTPRPLQAYMFVPPWSGSSGGQGTSFSEFSSDFAPVIVDAVTIGVPTIGTQARGTQFSIPITATAGGGAVALENVEITIAISGNQGDPATIIGNGCTGTSCTLYTDEAGLANFLVTFTKSGGYTLSVSAVFSGFTIPVQYTNLFNVIGMD